jgi:iron-sulfur cluster repair protein YtfE (RIC family)
MKKPSSPHDLLRRSKLPDEFLIILSDYPRDSWENHRDFNGLAAFWLDRHLNFRHVLQHLAADAEARLDQKLSARDYAKRLSRTGTNLLNDLIGHHQIEDHSYFPELARLEPRIARGFDILDADHHHLHDLIDRFAMGANRVIDAPDDHQNRERAAEFLTDLNAFDRLLARHLTDEEDLVLPVVLKHRIG